MLNSRNFCYVKDALGINNPMLIENLDPGLYSIQKEFDAGETEEVIILKENN